MFSMISLSRRAWLGLALAWMGAAPPAAAADSVSLEEAHRLSSAGKAVLIDVREPDEHRTGVAPGAKLLPLSQWMQRRAEVPTDPQVPVLLICRTHNRSQRALHMLRASGGYAHVRSVEGGMSQWAQRGYALIAPGGR